MATEWAGSGKELLITHPHPFLPLPLPSSLTLLSLSGASAPCLTICLPSPTLGMRILVNLLLDTLPMLGNVLLLCFFVFFIFGIIGVQLWAGLLRNRCFLEENFTV